MASSELQESTCLLIATLTWSHLNSLGELRSYHIFLILRADDSLNEVRTECRSDLGHLNEQLLVSHLDALATLNCFLRVS